MGDSDVTGSISATPVSAVVATPTETDLAFARNAASDVLTKGDKDSSQPWENPETGARGSVTPLAKAYASEGRICRDFLASYVNGRGGNLAAGRRLPVQPGPVGNSYPETLETGLELRRGPLQKCHEHPR